MEKDGGWGQMAGLMGLLGGSLTAYTFGKKLDAQVKPKTTEEYESELQKAREQQSLCQQIILDTATALSDAKREIAAAGERARLEKLRTDAVERAFEKELSESAKLTAEAQAGEREAKSANEVARADIVRLLKENQELRKEVERLREYTLHLMNGHGSAETPKEGT